MALSPAMHLFGGRIVRASSALAASRRAASTSPPIRVTMGLQRLEVAVEGGGDVLVVIMACAPYPIRPVM